MKNSVAILPMIVNTLIVRLSLSFLMRFSDLQRSFGRHFCLVWLGKRIQDTIEAHSSTSATISDTPIHHSLFEVLLQKSIPSHQQKTCSLKYIHSTLRARETIPLAFPVPSSDHLKEADKKLPEIMPSATLTSSRNKLSTYGTHATYEL